MATRTLGPGSLSIGPAATPRQFAADTTATTLSPDTDGGDNTNYLDGHTEVGEDTTTWNLGGTISEDYDAAGLQVWAAQNAGTEQPFVWVPNDLGALTISGVVKIRPIGFGGDVKAKNTQDFEFPLVGDPTFSE
ncbi:hypothetical protein [Mycetocola reblochoni]|uniref:hypothetical protein n=1 Tax=Mycetocola reblochoni TaxID=331618 RepID=UPI003F94AA0F